MKKLLFKIIPFVLTSLLVVGYWKLSTLTEFYAWNPQGEELLLLETALTSIFFYKTTLWLLVSNSIMLSVTLIIRKKLKMAGTALLLSGVLFVFVGKFVKNQCAPLYYEVFLNQSVPEELILEPVLKAGYGIGPFLSEGILDRANKHRRYAILGIQELRYVQATDILRHILFDDTENEHCRVDAYEALHSFDTEETRKTLKCFGDQATKPVDKRVISNVSTGCSAKEQ